MINTNKLKGKLAENEITQTRMAELIGITPKTFYEKMSKGVFGSDEINVMRKKLHLSAEESISIFFGD